jgi:hypothetical protein
MVAEVNSGSDPASWRKVSPQGYAGPVPSTPLGSWPALLVILALAGPVVGVAAWRANRTR